MGAKTIYRWEHLLATPKQLQAKLDRIAQRTLDAHGRCAFPSSIRYPITDTDGERYQTLDAYLRGLRWRATQARLRHERHGRCRGCGSRVGVAAYHLSYQHIGIEADGELILLCGRCVDYLRQQQRVGRRYGGRVQRLQHWIWTTKQEHERIQRRRRELLERPTPKEPTSSQRKVYGRTDARMGELIVLFIDNEPLFLDVLDV